MLEKGGGREMNEKWRDRKRTLFGLPWSFTIYQLTEEKLLIRTGFLKRREEEVRLYRILDLSYEQSLGERIFGLGTIHCWAADKSTPEFKILHIKDSERVKNMLSDMIEEQRTKKRVSSREFMTSVEDEEV